MSNYEIIKEIESAQLRQEALAPFNTGDTIKVYNKIKRVTAREHRYSKVQC